MSPRNNNCFTCGEGYQKIRQAIRCNVSFSKHNMCVEGLLITELQILAMTGTSRDDMCVYLPLCLISKLNQKDHKGNNIFYQSAVHLEQLKR